MKELDKTLGKDLNELKKVNLSHKKLKIMNIKMLTKFRRTMHEHKENFNNAL